MKIAPIRPASAGSSETRSSQTRPTRQKIRISHLQDKKERHEPISSLSLSDFMSARLADEAGIDLILVGDSLAMTTLGYENTLPVTMDEMLHHTRAVRRGVRYALLVADMPFASYHVSTKDSLQNAARFMKEAGAEAVKLEGGEKRAELIRTIVDAEIPVMGHIGLTPQSIHRMSGYKVQGKSLAAAENLMRDAIALERAGVFSIVLEGVPREVAAMISAEVQVPTIGIGAGPDCDGQILVFQDLIGLSTEAPAKFVRKYADAAGLISGAVEAFKADIESRQFPNDSESYHLPTETQSALEPVRNRKRATLQ